MIRVFLVLPLLLSVLTLQPSPNAQAQDLRALEDRVRNLESELEGLADLGLVMFLFGCFCALWAQNTARSAWGWFFLGLFFGPITAIVLLVKNADDRERKL